MKNFKKIWLIGILLSFAYEMPLLMLTSIDRFNPRLFDVLFIIGLLKFSQDARKPITNTILQIWDKMIKWMSLCCIIYVILIHNAATFYSLYYLFKYIEGYIVLRIIIANKDLLTLDLLEKVFIVAGVFISIYSLPQYLSTEVKYYELSPGKMVAIEPGTIVGPYTGSYFSIAQIIPMCTLFCLSRFVRVNSKLQKMILLFLTLLIAFPGLNAGSRTAFYLTIATSVIFLAFKRKISYIICLCVIAGGMLFFSAEKSGTSVVDYAMNNNSTLTRQQELDEEGGSGSTVGRLLWFKNYSIDYDYAALTPVIGSGFYISPVNGKYRIGYGEHNNYFFAFEQLGIYGAILFILLFVRSLKQQRLVKENNGVAYIGFAYFFVMLFANFTGQSFWHGFGTINMNTLVVLLMILSVEPYIKESNENN